MQKNVDNNYKNKAGKQKKASVILAVAGLLLGTFILAGGWIGQWREAHCGIPDAVRSRTVNGECYLDVVANADKIEDMSEFARTVVQLCRDNAFRSTRLSTDLNGYPLRLEIKVYLQRSEVGEKEPVCCIRFEPPEEEGEAGIRSYNIKDDAQKYKLYVDDRQIPCYY